MRPDLHSSPRPAARQRRPCGRLLLAPLLCALHAAAAAQAGPHVHVVSMEAVRFSPPELRVAVGDTVEWRNADPFPHNATARDGQFRSAEIEAGRSWRFRADTKGRFPYACTLHPGMEAVLVVE